ncbi:MAG: prepilin-type N-terminal cleavage/methylation domain-containing protein [Candidatus Saccharimonadales bacterium]
MRKINSGFTMVELLIVIVVIGILAAITITAFNGVQQKARDAQRKSDLANIAKALHRYNIENGNFAVTGCGNGSGQGWFDYDYDGVGPNKTSRQCLSDGGYIPAGIVDPSGARTCGGATCHAYIKWTCGLGTFLYANLETLPQNTTTSDGTCEPDNDTTAGVNYVLQVD